MRARILVFSHVPMDCSTARRYCRYLLVFTLALGAGVSCRGGKEPPVKQLVVPDALKENRLGGLAGTIYQSQAGSSIPWQPWGNEVFQDAAGVKRLVLAVVVLPQQQDYQERLLELEKDPAVLKIIRDNYVPVLVDGDIAREIGLLAESLCREIKRPLQMPLFIWMTPEKNPVAWIPVSDTNERATVQTFLQSHSMVERMWREDHAYVMRNSALDNTSRQGRMAEAMANGKPSADPGGESIQGVRQLVSLYDPVSRTIDETGGLFPVGPLDMAAVSALLPGVPASLKQRGRDTNQELLKDLVSSAMFDPLEGGVFSGRMLRSWDLPMFGWNCPDQAKVAVSLLRAHRLTGDRITLERGLGVIGFAERKFAGEDGLFRIGSVGSTDPRDWMWTVAEIREVLPEEDAAWWIAATGMQELGNLPSEIDSSRKYFRLNTLALRQPLEKTAEQLKVDPAKFLGSFEKSRETLRKIRENRWKNAAKDDTPNAMASFRMVTAYAAAYTATGENGYREKAVALLDRARNIFFKDGVLKAVAGSGGPSITDARAFVHALAIQASQDVADITLDRSPLEWAGKIAGITVEGFLKDHGVFEVSTAAAVLDLPVIDTYRVYDDSTGGLFALTEARSIGQSGDFPETLQKLSKPLPSFAAAAPIIYGDSILAALVKYHSRNILIGAGLSPEMTETLSRLPLQLFPRTVAKDSDGVPSGSVRVISTDGGVKVIANSSELLKELLLSDR